MEATISPRPVSPDLEYCRLMEVTSPLVMVKLAGLPIAVPEEFAKDTLPVQLAAVPVDDAEALFSRLICRVSVLASPIGGSGRVRVLLLVLVCANADAARHPRTRHFRTVRTNILLSSCWIRLGRVRVHCEARRGGMVRRCLTKDKVNVVYEEFTFLTIDEELNVANALHAVAPRIWLNPKEKKVFGLRGATRNAEVSSELK